MPYLPTTQAYLEQSALLLQAYPDTTRITTKYHFPRPQKTTSKQAQKPTSDPATTTTTTDTQTPPAAPIASLTLKTYNPTSGICLKYRTNKAAEVGRLITSLGKLAGGADVASLGLSASAPAVAASGDVEMTDAPEEGAIPAAAAAPTTATTGASGKGGKGGKKKGGKGKR